VRYNVRNFLMYFDFEDNHPDVPTIGRALSVREGALLSIIVHLLMIIVVILNPQLPGAEAARKRVAEQLALQRERDRQAQRFVFVQPHIDAPAPAPPKLQAPPSDKDRIAQTRERPANPSNSMPFSRGNTPERVESPAAPRPAPPPPEPQPEAQPGNNGQGHDGSEGKSSGPALANNGLLPSAGDIGRGTGTRGTGDGNGLLGKALRDLDRYVRQETFDNPGGGDGKFGPSIQFDTKGVEFGPWIRRFIAQIKRNWFIPYAAMAMKGHVVVTFYVMKDGRVMELAVPGPCNVDAFNNAAYNAMASSNPTYPLPPEYPSDRAFFTVTFYYNETPPGGPGGS
jgi:TonB family protein